MSSNSATFAVHHMRVRKVSAWWVIQLIRKTANITLPDSLSIQTQFSGLEHDLKLTSWSRGDNLHRDIYSAFGLHGSLSL